MSTQTLFFRSGAAALLALGILYALYQLGLPLLRDPLEYILGSAQLRFFGLGQLLGLALLGVALGVGGAALSLARLEESS